MKKLHVLVVDDSAVVRQVLTSILGPEMTVTVAADPYIAMMKLQTLRPDVMVLDLEMPRMDGITFLRKIMSESPLPVVVCSSLTEASSEMTMRALQLGAVDVVLKPRLRVGESLEGAAADLLDTIRGAAQARVGRLRGSTTAASRRRDPVHALARREEPSTLPATTGPLRNVIVVGASTGGTEVIQQMLDGMPADGPAMVIVQHMPQRFTAAFARRLNETSAMEVREASGGELVRNGVALIAPGDQHISLVRNSSGALTVSIHDAPAVNRHRPSVDVLFLSAARALGAGGIGVLMTGMGRDGARGLLEMRSAGAWTIAQNEATSVVFGMPGAAIQLGAAMHVVPGHDIARFVLEGRAVG